MVVVTIINECAKGERSSRRGHQEVVQDDTLQTKLSGDIEGLSKARCERIKSTTGDDDDSNPEC